MDQAINRAVRLVRRVLAGGKRTGTGPFTRVSLAYDRSLSLVRLYYLTSVYVCYSLLARFDRLAEEAGAWQLLWPLTWAEHLDAQTAVRVLGIAGFIAALLASMLPGSRIARALFALLFLGLAAVPNSLGAVNHGYHAWFWIGFCLILLPSGTEREVSRATKMAFLSVISTLQALLLLFYSLSGTWKVVEGFAAWRAGIEGNFSYMGFSRVLANRVVETGTSPPLADVFINNPWLAWPCFMVVIYIQMVSVLIAFRPALHVAWGYLLILFHFDTWLLMEIPFPLHVLFLVLFFVLSPFRPESAKISAMVHDLPIFSGVVTMAKRLAAR